MQLLRDRPKPQVSLRLTAMIDIVFLLVIFFMTVAQLDREAKEDLPLAEATAAEAAEAGEARLILNLRKDGSLAAGGIDLDATGLAALLAEAVSREGKDRLRCVLRVDRETSFAAVRGLLGHLATAGVWRLSYSVIPVEEAP